MGHTEVGSTHPEAHLPMRRRIGPPVCVLVYVLEKVRKTSSIHRQVENRGDTGDGRPRGLRRAQPEARLRSLSPSRGRRPCGGSSAAFPRK